MKSPTASLPFYRPSPQCTLRLFCFPFAGGGASTYHGWGRQLPDSVDVCAVQLPGRENRIHERNFTELEQLLDNLVRDLTWALDLPFMFFGHSMGALIAYELAVRLRMQGHHQPSQLFVSARRAPDIPPDEEDADEPHPLQMDDDQLMAKLRRLNAAGEAKLLDPSLREMFLPVFRADLALIESHQFEDLPPLNCPIRAYGAIQDHDVPKEHLDQWRLRTSQDFIVRMFPGDHFYLKDQQYLLLQTLARDLLTPLT